MSVPYSGGLVHGAKGAALAGWLHHDPEMAIALMKAENPVALWDMLQNNPVGPLALREAAALVRALTENPLPDSSAQDSLVERFFQNGAGNEGVTVPHFFPLLSEQAQLGRIGETVIQWSDRDRAAAVAWLKTLPPGPVRETGESVLKSR